MNQRIEILLDQQTDIILNISHALDFLLYFPDYKKEIGYQPKELMFIYNMVRNQTIIYTTQLFHGKEHYSFNELRKVLMQINKNDDKPIEFFGGEKAFKKNKERDERKKKLFKMNNSYLIEVRRNYNFESLIQEINKTIGK